MVWEEANFRFDDIRIEFENNYKSLFNADLYEMTWFENAFLLGLIKKYKPKKILEVGVSSGGTSAMILSLIQKFSMESTLYSVDINDMYYHNSNLETGFIAKKIFNKSDSWNIFTGNILPAYINEIGNNINFLILDTAHLLPGEALDFLTALPYLDDNAIIVIHDIAMYAYIDHNLKYAPYTYATKLLYDIITGEKILCKDPEKDFYIPNIGAIKINKDTYKYASDVFLSLSFPWYYMPDKIYLDLYENFYAKHYQANLVDYFRQCINLQHVLFKKYPH